MHLARKHFGVATDKAAKALTGAGIKLRPRAKRTTGARWWAKYGRRGATIVECGLAGRNRLQRAMLP